MQNWQVLYLLTYLLTIPPIPQAGFGWIITVKYYKIQLKLVLKLQLKAQNNLKGIRIVIGAARLGGLYIGPFRC